MAGPTEELDVGWIKQSAAVLTLYDVVGKDPFRCPPALLALLATGADQLLHKGTPYGGLQFAVGLLRGSGKADAKLSHGWRQLLQDYVSKVVVTDLQPYLEGRVFVEEKA